MGLQGRLEELSAMDTPEGVLCFIVKQRFVDDVKYDDLVREMKAAGFESHIPEKTTYVHAMSEARIRLKNEHGKMVEVRKFPDSDDERCYGLHYWEDDIDNKKQSTQQQNTVTLNKHNGDLTFNSSTLEQEFRDYFQHALTVVSNETVRRLVIKMLESIGSIVWGGRTGSAGGSYILPARSIESLKAIRLMLRNLGGNLYKFPILEGDDSDRQDVRDDVLGEHLRRLTDWIDELDAMDSGENERWKPATVSRRLSQCSLLRTQSNLYRDILGEEMKQLNKKTKALEKKAKDLLQGKTDETEAKKKKAKKKKKAVRRGKANKLLNI